MSQSNAEEASEVEINEDFILDLYSHNLEKKLFATKSFNSLFLKKTNRPISEVIQIGLVHRFVELLKQNGNSSLQYEAAAAVTNISTGTSLQIKVLIKAGAVPVLIQLLNSKCDHIQEEAVWALGNIAGDNSGNRDYVLEQGILMPLLQLLSKRTRISMIRNAVWTLTSLCRGKNPPPKFEQISPSLPVLSRLLTHTDAEVISNACWAFSYISNSPENIQAVIDAGVCDRLVQLIMHSSENVVSPALRAVGNIATGDNNQIRVILNCNALLPSLLQLLSSPKENIKADVCWMISNITSGNRQQILAVLDLNIIPRIMEILNEADCKTRKEAFWVLANATSGGSPEQLGYLIEQQCIHHLCEHLEVLDSKIMKAALKSLKNI